MSDDTETIGAVEGGAGEGPGVTVCVGTAAVNVAACNVWTASVSASSRLIETDSSVVAGSFAGGCVEAGDVPGRLQASAASKRTFNTAKSLLAFLMVLLMFELSHKLTRYISPIRAIGR